MNKLYWKLRQAMSKRNKIMYVVVDRPREYRRKPIIRTYPSYRWGYGYWLHRRKGRGFFRYREEFSMGE